MKNINETASANFRHMIRLSYILQQTVITEASLPPKLHGMLVASSLCCVQMNRIVNLCDYLYNIDKASQGDRIQTFEIKNLIEDISDTFYNTLCNHLTIDIKISVDLKDTTCIMVDKTRFELAILNLLYCSIKTNGFGKPEPVKLTITVKENKDSVIFQIKDNNRPSSTESISQTFKLARSKNSLWDDYAQSSMLSLSVKAAQIATEHMNGSLVHTAMKSGNKFELSLPKRPANIRKMQSISRYTPTQSYFQEIFSDICMEQTLKEVDEAFDGLDKVKL